MGADNVLETFQAGSPLLQCCTCSLMINREVGGADNVPGESHFFKLESHGCQSKWMSMLQTFLNR